MQIIWDYLISNTYTFYTLGRERERERERDRERVRVHKLFTCIFMIYDMLYDM